jgi:hypothetical protein
MVLVDNGRRLDAAKAFSLPSLRMKTDANDKAKFSGFGTETKFDNM